MKQNWPLLIGDSGEWIHGGLLYEPLFFLTFELFHNKMTEGWEGAGRACLDQVGAGSPQEGSADKESTWVC